jgi:hypothetical protein
MNRYYTILILTVFSQSVLFSQVKYSNEFLAIGVSAQAQGMANAQVAQVSDVSAGYWNPAGLARIESPLQIGAMHAEWFAGIAQYDWISIGKSLNKEKGSFLSFSLIRLGVDQIPYTINLVGADGSINYDNVTEFSAADYGLFLSYGRRAFHKNLTIGGSTKVIRRVVGQIGGAWGFGADLGAQWHGKKWQFGFMGRDLTTTFNAWKFTLTDNEKQVFQQTGNEIPSSNLEITRPKIIFGAARNIRFSEKYHLLAAIDADFTTDGQRNVLVSSKSINIDPKLGLELDYQRFIQIRAGIGNLQKVNKDITKDKKVWSAQPNFGIGIRLGRFRLDYALTNIGNVSEVNVSHIFSTKIDLKPKTAKQ